MIKLMQLDWFWYCDDVSPLIRKSWRFCLVSINHIVEFVSQYFTVLYRDVVFGGEKGLFQN